MKTQEKIKRKFELPGIRYLSAAACFMGIVVNFAIRISFNVALVAMINNTAVYHGTENKTSSNECKALVSNYNSSINNDAEDTHRDGEFSWSPKEQGILLGAYYYGYILLQVPYGRISEIYSSKWVFGIGTFISAVLTLLTPLAARLHLIALMVLRALEGLAQGMMLPTMYVIISNWFPDSEKNLIMGILICGCAIGAIVGMSVTGCICHSTLFGGWPTAFYVMGIFGILWFLVWWVVSADNPYNHPFITEKERNYITSNQNKEVNAKIPPFPWKKVFTTTPFWAYFITSFADDWVYFVLINDLPTYFATILHFDIQKNGFLSSFPGIASIVGLIFAGGLADLLIRRNIMQLKYIRKFSCVISSLIPSLFLMGVGLAGCNESLAIIFLVALSALGGLGIPGSCMTPLDMSPEYSGTIKGISNSFSTLNGFIVPMIIGCITNEQQTLEKWRLVFEISAAIQGTGAIIFILFSSSENQNWIEK